MKNNKPAVTSVGNEYLEHCKTFREALVQKGINTEHIQTTAEEVI